MKVGEGEDGWAPSLGEDTEGRCIGAGRSMCICIGIGEVYSSLPVRAYVTT